MSRIMVEGLLSIFEKLGQSVLLVMMGVKGSGLIWCTEVVGNPFTSRPN
jgi:hypothetical protein